MQITTKISEFKTKTLKNYRRSSEIFRGSPEGYLPSLCEHFRLRRVPKLFRIATKITKILEDLWKTKHNFVSLRGLIDYILNLIFFKLISYYKEQYDLHGFVLLQYNDAL